MRFTIELDEDTAEQARRAAERAGLSPDDWVAELVRRRISGRWPESVVRLAGAWAQFPMAEELRAGYPPDVRREPL